MIPSKVTIIEEYAFDGCDRITSVAMPDALKSLRQFAFRGCTSLTSVAVPDAVATIGWHVFDGCTSLKSAVIGKSVTTIGGCAFYECRSLESVKMPETVSIIRASAFHHCESLASIDLPSSLTTLGGCAFYNCSSLEAVDLPDSLESIEIQTFYDCKSLASVHLPDSLTSIEQMAFMSCSSLASIVFPESLKTVGIHAFENCASLEHVDFGMVESIMKQAFSNTPIRTIDLPETVKRIGGSAFYGCDHVVSLYVPEGVRYDTDRYGRQYLSPFPGFNFDLVDWDEDYYFTESFPIKGMRYIGENSNLKCMSGSSSGYCGFDLVWSMDDEGNLTIVGSGPMDDYGLSDPSPWKLAKTATISDSVTHIGSLAFYDCALLVSINYPSSLRTIGNGAFYKCASLESVDLPESVTGIGDMAFWDCTSIKSLYVPKGAKFTDPDPEMEIYSDPFGMDIEFLGLDGDREGWFSKGFRYVGENSVLRIVLEEGSEFECMSDGCMFSCVISSLDSRTVEIAGVERYNLSKTRLAIPKTIMSWGADFKVESIGPRAFFGEAIANLTTVDLGSVTEIGMKAFARCEKLSAVYAGDSLKTIGSYAFYGCKNLETFDLEESLDELNTIKPYAFYGCRALESISMPSGLEKIGKRAFTVGFVDEDGNPLDKTAPSLAGYAYLNIDGVMVRQPGPVVGSEYELDSLTYKVTSTLPARLEVSGYNGSIKNVTVPESLVFDECEFEVVTIGSAAFKGCRTLASIDMPYVEKIGKEAFYGCSRLAEVILGDAESIGTKAFANCSRLSEIALGDDLETISAYAFYKCRSLQSIDAPDSLKTVGSYAFFRCYSLESVGLGASAEKLCSHSFEHCGGMASIGIPESVRIIGSGAFGGLTFLDSEGDELAHDCGSLSRHFFSGSSGILTISS